MQEKTDQQIYEDFAAQLCEWGKSGALPASGNQDIRYGLELQRKRMEKYQVKIEYRLNLREGRQEHVSSAAFSDLHYTNKLVWKAFRKETDYFREGRKCLSVKDNQLLYTIVTWLNGGTDRAPYICPNCGAVSQVSELLEGCPYCHTRFLMSDLYPKVTNYYFLRDYGLGEQEAGNSVRKWMVAGAAAGMVLRLPGILLGLFHGENLFFLLLSTLLTMGVTAGLGYFVLSLSLAFRVFKDGFKQAPRAAAQIKAKKELTSFMKQFDPGFTFEYFFGKVQSLVKILMFADDRENLAVYEGRPEECSFDDIADAQFEGAVSLNACRLEGNYCHLDLEVYMTEVYCRNQGLHQQSDRFRIGLCRNISHPVDYGFSIKGVSCKSCGASFDATRERLCPYCRSRYDLKEDDWVITYIRRQP